jgi:hypothetical protein
VRSALEPVPGVQGVTVHISDKQVHVLAGENFSSSAAIQALKKAKFPAKLAGG